MTTKGPATDGTRYEVLTQEDKTNKDILIPIPPVLLEKIGWKEGDEIEFGVDATGNYVLKKVVK